jgi:hypothetical protein
MLSAHKRHRACPNSYHNSTPIRLWLESRSKGRDVIFFSLISIEMLRTIVLRFDLHQPTSTRLPIFQLTCWTRRLVTLPSPRQVDQRASLPFGTWDYDVAGIMAAIVHDFRLTSWLRRILEIKRHQYLNELVDFIECEQCLP